jgi:hypothetical protein
MKKITKKLWSHASDIKRERQYVTDIQKNNPKSVHTYRELVKEVATISFNNPELNIFYRGQRREHKIGDRGTSLYPPIFRKGNEKKRVRDVLNARYTKLQKASKQLLIKYKENGWHGRSTLEKFPEVCWAILQHYEACDTPLLDITSSLRVACSSALRKASESAIVYIIGLPHTNGSISYYADEEQIIVRLLSICPPNALRPYYQEGYLVGTFPTIEVKARTPSLDVANRLVAKFQIPKRRFWDKHFTEIPELALFPKNDEMYKIATEIKEAL